MKYPFFIILFFIFCSPAFAAAPSYPPAVAQAEKYINNIKTAQARFLQTAQDGTQAIGTFYLDRPGKLRFEYDDPIEDFIVADGFLIYFYDAGLGEQSNSPIGLTLADFILRPDLRFEGKLTITDITRSGGLLQITLVQTDDPEAGAITLGFEENPMVLKKWRITDSMNNITEIELFQLQTGIKLDDRLFVYIDPKRFQGNRYHYND